MEENSATGAITVGERTEGCLIGGNMAGASKGQGGTNGQNHLPKNVGNHRRGAMKKTEPRIKEVLRNRELQITLKGGGMSPRTKEGIRIGQNRETQNLLKVAKCAEEALEVQARQRKERIQLTRVGRGQSGIGRILKVRPQKNPREGQ